MMRKVEKIMGSTPAQRGKVYGCLGLAAGLGLLWMAAYVILPWGKTLPYVKPIMQAIDESDINVGQYWYTQSEETAIAQMYVRHAIRNQ